MHWDYSFYTKKATYGWENNANEAKDFMQNDSAFIYERSNELMNENIPNIKIKREASDNPNNRFFEWVIWE